VIAVPSVNARRPRVTSLCEVRQVVPLTLNPRTSQALCQVSATDVRRPAQLAPIVVSGLSSAEVLGDMCTPVTRFSRFLERAVNKSRSAGARFSPDGPIDIEPRHAVWTVYLSPCSMLLRALLADHRPGRSTITTDIVALQGYYQRGPGHR